MKIYSLYEKRVYNSMRKTACATYNHPFGLKLISIRSIDLVEEKGIVLMRSDAFSPDSFFTVEGKLCTERLDDIYPLSY